MMNSFEFEFFFGGFVDLKWGVVADEGFAEFVDGEHEENFTEVEMVVKFGVNSDGEHLGAVDVFGDRFETVAINTPVLPTGADGVFEFIADEVEFNDVGDVGRFDGFSGFCGFCGGHF